MIYSMRKRDIHSCIMRYFLYEFDWYEGEWIDRQNIGGKRYPEYTYKKNLCEEIRNFEWLSKYGCGLK